MSKKTFFDKKRCRSCKYRGNVDNRMICNYLEITNTTCLYRVKNEIYDRRGTDPHNCLLYEQGRKIVKRVKPREIRHKGASE